MIARGLARIVPTGIRMAQDVSRLSRTVSATLMGTVLVPGCDPAMLVHGVVITLQRSVVGSRVIERLRAWAGLSPGRAGRRPIPEPFDPPSVRVGEGQPVCLGVATGPGRELDDRMARRQPLRGKTIKRKIAA